jgi:hypothetical protein
MRPQGGTCLHFSFLPGFGWKASSPPHLNGFALIQGLAFCKGQLAQFEHKTEKTNDTGATYCKVHDREGSLDQGIPYGIACGMNRGCPNFSTPNSLMIFWPSWEVTQPMYAMART